MPITVRSAKNNGHFICYTDIAKETLSFVVSPFSSMKSRGRLDIGFRVR